MKIVIGIIIAAIALGGAIFFANKNTEAPIVEDILTEQKQEVISDITVSSEREDTSIQSMQQAEIHTNKGIITVELFPNEAPKTVKNFATLSTNGFYEGTKFHRVIQEFMIQGGDPNSKDDDWSDDGRGGPGYAFEDEINEHKIVNGALAMANSGPSTNGSQFFIVTAEAAPWLDGLHTVFGRVIGGMDVVAAIAAVSVNENDHPTVDMIIEKIVIK